MSLAIFLLLFPASNKFLRVKKRVMLKLVIFTNDESARYRPSSFSYKCPYLVFFSVSLRIQSECVCSPIERKYGPEKLNKDTSCSRSSNNHKVSGISA